MRSLIATTLILSMAACAAPAPRLTPAPDPDAVLDAQLFPPYYGQVAVHLTKPAYIALFEVVPGRGVSLLYPRGGSGFQQTTQLWVPMQYNPQRWLYSSRYAGSSGYYGYGYGPGYGVQPYGGAYSAYRNSGSYYGPSDGYQGPPRYIFLVASEQPLQLGQFQGSGTAIRAYLGAADYEGYYPYDVMERLAYAVLPFSSAESWASDVYVDWGYDWGYGAGPGQVAAMASYRTVRCPDGTFGSGRYVSGWGWDVPPCVNHMTVTPQRPGRPPIGRPTPGDSAAPDPSGRGRSRGAPADSAGRRRDLPAQETRVVPPAKSAEMRQRIEELRAEAGDVRLRERAAAQLERDVIRRQASSARPGMDRYEPRGNALRDESPTRRRDAELQRRREEARRDTGNEASPRSTPSAGTRDARSTRESETPRARPSTSPRAKAPASRGSTKPEASAPRTRSTAPAPRPQPTRTKQGTTRTRPPAL
jgi:hypothetical protein